MGLKVWPSTWYMVNFVCEWWWVLGHLLHFPFITTGQTTVQWALGWKVKFQEWVLVSRHQHKMPDVRLSVAGSFLVVRQASEVLPNILFWCLDIENHWRSLIWNFTFHPSGHSLFRHWQNLLKLRISLKTSKKLSLFCSPSFSLFTWYFIIMESCVSIHQRKVSIKPVGNQHCIEGTDKCTAGHATHFIMSGLWWNKTHPIIWGLQNL